MYCGAENDDTQLYCDGCGDKRPGVSSGKKPTVVSKTKSTKEARDEAQDFERPGEQPELADEALEAENTDEEEEGDELEETEVEEADEKESFHLPEPVISVESPFVAPATPITPTATGQGYYLVFVNTPAQGLIKSKVAIEFDTFPVITIGRSPENIVVIPDQEVSRKHAQLTQQGDRILLKDLKSSNGTFVYDGKEFQRVSDSVEVRPNSILKFGTNTVVRLVSG